MAGKETPNEKAQKYYPRLWNKERIDALYKAGKLTEKEYNSIINNK